VAESAVNLLSLFELNLAATPSGFPGNIPAEVAASVPRQ